ncbi:ATP phosphoribosyltransferase regulatory subunit, partial [Catenibacterium sp.]|uniref:ATP phosphoribosyltransferase regulatory subunit n=1 Tax=Catenibacterium sp. TaxID=2049022 RepID=UPI003FD7968D
MGHFGDTELFSRAVGDTTDVVTKEMYTFKDKGDRSLTLRPEGTAGIARAYVEDKMYALPEKLQKVYYMGPMFRYERPQNGRQRQFHQFGVEMLGVESPYVDVECMLMAVTIVEALGIKNIKLHINSLGDDESRTAYREALKDHFRPVLNDLCEDCQARFEKNPLRILDCKVDAKNPVMASAPRTIDYL